MRGDGLWIGAAAALGLGGCTGIFEFKTEVEPGRDAQVDADGSTVDGSTVDGSTVDAGLDAPLSPDCVGGTPVLCEAFDDDSAWANKFQLVAIGGTASWTGGSYQFAVPAASGTTRTTKMFGSQTYTFDASSSSAQLEIGATLGDSCGSIRFAELLGAGAVGFHAGIDSGKLSSLSYTCGIGSSTSGSVIAPGSHVFRLLLTPNLEELRIDGALSNSQSVALAACLPLELRPAVGLTEIATDANVTGCTVDVDYVRLDIQ